MEDYIEDSIDLFSDINTENEKYFNSLDCLDFLAEKTNNHLGGICRYLLINNFHHSIKTFHMNYLGVMEEKICRSGEYNLVHIDYTKDLLEKGLEDFEDSGSYSNDHDRSNYEHYYWLKTDFLEFTAIQRLNITENDFIEFVKNRSEEHMVDLFIELDLARHKIEMSKPAQDTAKNFFNHIQDAGLEQSLDNQNSIIDQLKKENDQLKARIAELESQQNNITEPTELNGIHAINQHKSDLQGMARVIASKKWADNHTVLIGKMADAVYREVARYTTDMPQNLDTVKNWIRPVAPVTAQKRGRPPNKN